jgi:hypothetical protein
LSSSSATLIWPCNAGTDRKRIFETNILHPVHKIYFWSAVSLVWEALTTKADCWSKNTSPEVHDQEPFLLNNFGQAATDEAALCWVPLKRKLKHYFQESVKTVLVIFLFNLSAENSKVKTYQNLMDWFCNLEKNVFQ